MNPEYQTAVDAWVGRRIELECEIVKRVLEVFAPHGPVERGAAHDLKAHLHGIVVEYKQHMADKPEPPTVVCEGVW